MLNHDYGADFTPAGVVELGLNGSPADSPKDLPKANPIA